ncbi:MAG: hypothetical protein ACFCD0_26875 [Gemmataceae bacterium]
MRELHTHKKENAQNKTDFLHNPSENHPTALRLETSQTYPSYPSFKDNPGTEASSTPQYPLTRIPWYVCTIWICYWAFAAWYFVFRQFSDFQ